MTEREREIFLLIEANPLISQAEIANTLSIARASVAVHISNLIKKGYILGKGYIMAESNVITVIGGANVDIQGRPSGKLLMEDSNPGFIVKSLGGVGRNIAENLSLLGMDVRMITAIGDDQEGRLVLENARHNSIDMQDSIISNNHRTSTYLYIVNQHGEMVTAVSDMSIIDALTPSMVKPLITGLERSPYTVIDANLPTETIQYLAETLSHTKLILDPVSIAKVGKTVNVLEHFYAAKFNRNEAEALLSMTLDSEASYYEAGQALLSKGLEKVFITLGGNGVYYCDAATSFFKKAHPIHVKNATGAGDAFTAGIVYGLSQGLTPEYLVDFAMSAAALTIKDEATISQQLCVSSVEHHLKETQI